MGKHQRQFSGKVHVAGIILAAGLLAGAWSRAGAAPFTDHFDPLIADLQGRAITLSNSTDKVQQKQFKTIQTVLKTLQVKPSTSLAADIQNLGGLAKTLVKAFPGDFPPTPSSLDTDLETALEGLVGDVQTVVNSTQTVLDGLGASSCQAKAQATLDAASNLVAQATAAADFVTASKLLGSGLKSALKAGAAAGKCSTGGGGGGGGGGDFIKATISGSLTLSFDAEGSGPTTATYDPTLKTFTLIGGESVLGGIGLGIDVSNITGPGTYPVGGGSNVSRLSPFTSYAFGTGTITFTTFDPVNQKAAGAFSFTATQVDPAGAGAVTVSNGTFSISKFVQP